MVLVQRATNLSPKDIAALGLPTNVRRRWYGIGYYRTAQLTTRLYGRSEAAHEKRTSRLACLLSRR